MTAHQMLLRLRLVLAFFSISLFISGLTAIPLHFELGILNGILGADTGLGQLLPPLSNWISLVFQGIRDMTSQYPFIAYGYDWLAFGHFVIAIAFIGAIKDPIKNRWVIEFSMVACILIVPYALVFGQLRGIPLGWRFIDTLFGIVGFIPLYVARKMILSLEADAVPVTQ